MSPFTVVVLCLLLAGCHGMVKRELESEPVPPLLSNTNRGLQPGILYQYKYTATIATWISENPKQYSGSALRANLDLERTQDGSIRVKATNLEVALTNEKTSCDPQPHTDFSYHPMERDEAALLEQPFLVYVDETEMYMKATSREPVWVTNLRRGIAYSLPVSILTGHSPSSLTYRLTEDTMIGKCFNWYSQLKLSSYLAALENQKLEEGIEVDVQRYAVAGSYTQGTKTGSKTKRPSKTSKTRSKTKTGTKTSGTGPTSPPSRLIQPINDTLWVVTRTLDEAGCEENHFTMTFHDNRESVERTQRSSQGTFLIRGEQGGVLRLERAEVKGDSVIYTATCKDKFIRTATKQVLELKAVRHGEVQVETAEELERTTLSFEKSRGGPDVLDTPEGILTDIRISNEQHENAKKKIKEYLSLLVSEGPEDDPRYMDIFQSIVDNIYVLTASEIEQFVSDAANTPKAKSILFQAFLASGELDAMRFIIQKMNDVSFRTEDTVLLFQLFQMATVTNRDPSIIPDLLNLVSTMVTQLGPDERISPTIFFLNLAQFVRESCIQPQSAESCDPRCDNNEILDSFLPLLSQGIRDPVKWKQMVSVQALCTLGTPHIIPILEPIIQGKNNDDTDVRISAIYCLTADHLPKTAHSMALDILIPLMNNPTEFPKVRSIAFLAITSWEPTNLSWWEYVALSTWRENSTQVASFISSALISLSEGKAPRSESAKKVVHLAKHPEQRGPYTQSTQPKSAYLYLDELAENCKGGMNMNMAWLSSTKPNFPWAVLLYLQLTGVMGTKQRITEVLFGNQLQNLMNIVVLEKLDKTESPDSETFFGIFEELLENLELSPIDFVQGYPYGFISQLEPFHETFAEGSERTQWLSRLRISNNIPVHFRTADLTLAFASDLGLPVIVKYMDDEAYSVGAQDPVNLDYQIVLMMDAKTSLTVKVAVPWEAQGQGVAAGAILEAKTRVFLPLNIQLLSTNVVWELPPTQTNLLTVSSSMYTTLTPLFAFNEPGQGLGRKAVSTGEMVDSSTKSQSLEKLGIHLTFDWRGDFQQPGDFMTTFIEFNNHELEYNNYEYKLVFDPALSVSKTITFTGSFQTKERKVTEVKGDQFSQVSQGAADYEFMTQVSGSSDSEFFSQTSDGDTGFIDQGTQSQAVTTHLQRIEDKFIDWGGVINTVSLGIEPDAGPRKYEYVVSLLTVSQKKIGSKTPTLLHVTFVNSSVTDIFANIQWTCFDILQEAPSKETNPTENIAFSMFKTDYCDGPPAMEIKARLEVSSTALQHARDEAQKETCDGSSSSGLFVLYDTWHVEVTGAQELVSVADIAQSLGSLILPDLDIDRITVEAQFDFKASEWKISVPSSQKPIEFSVPKDNAFLEILGFGRNYALNVFDDKHYHTCSVMQDKVRTFDGLVHAFEPSSCWTAASIIAVTDISISMRASQFALQVRHNDDQWEVRFIWPYYGLMLDITRSEILVNEEPFSGQSDKFVLHRLPDKQVVEAGLVKIWVGDTVEISVSTVYHGKVLGLCGNYDGEPTNDMKGPYGCLYTDPALHTTAWSSPGYGCSRLALRSKRAKLAEFRETCDKEAFLPTGITQHNVMENCTAWEYHSRTALAGLQCTSKAPVPVCQPGCTPRLTYTTNLRYDCMVPRSESLQQQQQQQQYSSEQCLKTVLPATIPSGCFLQ